MRGIPADHTWNAVLVPMVWVSLPVYGHSFSAACHGVGGSGVAAFAHADGLLAAPGRATPGRLDFMALTGANDMGLPFEAMAAFG